MCTPEHLENVRGCVAEEIGLVILGAPNTWVRSFIGSSSHSGP